MSVIWHNPRCSKSRAALQLLQDAGHDPTIRLYLSKPPSIEELTRARDLLGLRTIEMMRVKEDLFRELGLAEADDQALLAAMAAHPVLIERPIVFAGERATIARPPEKVQAIL